MLKRFVLCVVVMLMIFKEVNGDFPLCGSGKLPCYTRWNGPVGVCYNPSTQVCLPVAGGENVVCSFGETVCGKQCYTILDSQTCWAYDTLCDQQQSACTMSELKKTQCYDFSKEMCFPKVVCSRNKFPCPNDDTKCCAFRK